MSKPVSILPSEVGPLCGACGQYVHRPWCVHVNPFVHYVWTIAFCHDQITVEDKTYLYTLRVRWV
jgi:hypothetical protein